MMVLKGFLKDIRGREDDEFVNIVKRRSEVINFHTFRFLFSFLPCKFFFFSIFFFLDLYFTVCKILNKHILKTHSTSSLKLLRSRSYTYSDLSRQDSCYPYHPVFFQILSPFPFSKSKANS